MCCSFHGKQYPNLQLVFLEIIKNEDCLGGYWLNLPEHCKLENYKSVEIFNLTFVGIGPKSCKLPNHSQALRQWWMLGLVLYRSCKFIAVLTIGFKTLKVAPFLVSFRHQATTTTNNPLFLSTGVPFWKHLINSFIH